MFVKKNSCNLPWRKHKYYTVKEKNFLLINFEIYFIVEQNGPPFLSQQQNKLYRYDVGESDRRIFCILNRWIGFYFSTLHNYIDDTAAEVCLSLLSSP